MYDLVLHGGRIVDGSGRAAFRADIGIVGPRIVTVSSSSLADSQAHCHIDVHDMVVAPGFIDAHTHDDLMILRKSVVLPKLYQGITTLVTGNCGFGLAPVNPVHAGTIKSYSAAVLGEDEASWDWATMGDLFQTLRTVPLNQHIRALTGHTALRVAVMGFESREASEHEMDAQEALLAEAMQSGSAGLSLGLMYIPGMYTPTGELVRLARIVSRYDGVVTVHMRGEGDALLTSIDEMCSLAEQAEVAVHISHLKVIGRKNWGSIQRALTAISDARARGLDITVDVYPYTAGSTTITQLLPPWVLAGGQTQMLARLREPDVRKRIYQDFAHGIPGWENQVASIGWERIYLASVPAGAHQKLEGLNLVEAAEKLALSPEEACLRLIEAEEGHITIVIFSMDEHDVDAVVQSSFAMIGSDGIPILTGRPHPRLYGTFPRFIQRYVRQLKHLELEAAIHKITAMPAARFGLTEQGEIAEGRMADLVVFDPDTIHDAASYRDPKVYPHGIAAVIVAGHAVLHGEEFHPHAEGQLIV